MIPEEAYDHALEHGPSDATRAVACEDPGWAYLYAVDIDEASRSDTREAACRRPYWAFVYALEVDLAPREDTRAEACKDPLYAYYYACDVDRAPHPDTRAAVEGTKWQACYEVRFGKLTSERQ